MAKNKKAMSQPGGGISIDSEKDAIVGNDLIGRDKVINVYKDTTPKSKRTDDFVECPMCGRYNTQHNAFRCLSCHRHYLCLEHRDPAALICTECLGEAQKLVSGIFGKLIQNRHMVSMTWGTTKVMFDDFYKRYPKYSHGEVYSESNIIGYRIRGTWCHSSGRITVKVDEQWHFVDATNEYMAPRDDFTSLSSSIELIRVEGILTVDVFDFLGQVR